MSAHFSWQAGVLSSDLESTTKLVLIVIGSRMNQHGDGAFPSYATIAKDASLNRATVIRHVELASEAGWIKKQSRNRISKEDGRLESDSNLYTVAYPLVAENDHPPVAEGNHPSRTKQLPLVAESDPNTPSLTPQLTPKSLEQEFDVFWHAGMVKTSKKKALSIFSSIVKRDKLDAGCFANKLAADVRARIQAGQFGFDKLHPTTYLNGERWSDALQTPTNQPADVSERMRTSYDRTADKDLAKRLNEANGVVVPTTFAPGDNVDF